MNVAFLLTKAARTYADKPAIKYGNQALTYGELESRVSRLAAGLTGLGLGQGDRVVIWMGNRPQIVEAIFAGLMAGCAVVPVNPRLHQAEVAYIVGDCDPGALLLDETFEFNSPLDPSIEIFRSDDLPYEVTGRTCADLSPDELAWLFYTSGTTGQPKGAMLTHRSLLAMTLNCLADVYSFQTEDVVLHAAPLTHGSGLYMLPSLARGAANVILQGGFEPATVFRTIEQERVTAIAFLAPTQIVKLISDVGLKVHNLASVRVVIYGGGPMYVEHMKSALRLLGQIWVQIYGQGETPMTGTYLRSADHRTDNALWERRLGSIGVSRTDVELRIRDADDKDVAAGEIGEIVIKGDTVMKGYWNNPEATAYALRDGWLRTGDLAYSDEDGYVYLVDRAKDMIISGGNNIYAREVEEALLTHASVAEVAVIGVPDDYWGESVHAVITLRVGESVNAQELIDHCRERLASFKKPRSVEFVAELPKNAYGKVLKRELRERFWTGRDRAIGGGHINRQQSGTTPKENFN